MIAIESQVMLKKFTHHGIYKVIIAIDLALLYQNQSLEKKGLNMNQNQRNIWRKYLEKDPD